MYTLVYFSPTGNVSYLAKTLANHLGPDNVDLLPLEFTEPSQLTSNTHLVLLYPIHGFNAPRTVKRFVKCLSPGLYDAVSLIGVGCTTHWMNEAASSDLRRLLSKSGYPVILDEILAMPLTFVMAFPDEVSRELIAESETKIKDISVALVEGETTIPRVTGKSRLLNFLGKAEPLASRFFGLELHAGKSCNSCGICWTNCPEKNIQRNDEGKPRFGFDCMMCMRCIYNCPQKAISPRFSKFLPIKHGYSLSQYLEE